MKTSEWSAEHSKTQARKGFIMKKYEIMFFAAELPKDLPDKFTNTKEGMTLTRAKALVKEFRKWRLSPGDHGLIRDKETGRIFGA